MTNRCLITFLMIVCMGDLACRCKYTCPAYDGSYIWQQPGDSIRFVNDNGYRISFGVISTEASMSYEEDAPPSRCSADENCHSKGSLEAGGIEARNGKTQLKLTNDRSSNGLSIINLMDFETQLDVHPNLEKYERLTFGPHTYDSVITRSIDTNLNYNKIKVVWRVYLNKQKGIIAFEDRQTRSVFYIQ